MDHYHLWCDLRDSRKDLEFCAAVRAYLEYLKGRGWVASWNLERRKFGFGPADLGEYHIVISFESLAKMDEAFGHVATRTGEVERLHMPVYALAANLKTALYRDFPDPQRGGGSVASCA